MLSSSRPYLLRAMYEWLTDNDLTPFIMIDTEQPGVDVPEECIDDAHIVLNIAPRAIRKWDVGPEQVTFKARFDGTPHEIVLPIASIMAIYASENGRGMVFDEDDHTIDGGSDDGSSGGQPKGNKPHLKVIK